MEKKGSAWGKSVVQNLVHWKYELFHLNYQINCDTDML